MSKANKAYKYRLYPKNKSAQDLIEKGFDLSRFAWNRIIDRRFEIDKLWSACDTDSFKAEFCRAYQQITGKESPDFDKLRARLTGLACSIVSKEITQLKKQEGYEWLSIAPARILDNVVQEQVKPAFDKFIKAIADGSASRKRAEYIAKCKSTGRKVKRRSLEPFKPKFKSFRDKQSFTLDRSFVFDLSSKEIRIKNKRFRVRMANNDFLLQNEALVKAITISRNGSGKYWVSVRIHDPDCINIDPAEHPQNPVGVDLGVKDLAITSEGKIYKNPKHYKNALARLRFLQRKAARQWEANGKVRSKNWEKTQRKIAKLHERIAFLRKHTTHTITNELTDNYDFIALEDLNVKGMSATVKKVEKTDNGKGFKQNGRKRKSALNRNIIDANFGEFRRQLEYKSKWKGGQVVLIDRFYPSSKACNSCGSVNNDLKLRDRNWTCPCCGEEHHRDINAAKNILKEGLNNM